jgi:hypothetical protein
MWLEFNWLTPLLYIALFLQVVLSAAVCTKGGKAIMARQFINMTRIRIEGLLAAFPKLMSGGRNTQHTFIETESVRCVSLVSA